MAMARVGVVIMIQSLGPACKVQMALFVLLRRADRKEACLLLFLLFFSRPVFTRPFFAPLLATPLPPLFSAPSRAVLHLRSALFCRATWSVERGSFRMDLSTKFGKESA